MQPAQSQPADWVGQPALGFVINAPFSLENQQLISMWLSGLRQVVPNGLYAMRPEGLHITVLDWVAPLFDYAGADKRSLFETLRPGYEPAFKRITQATQPFEVRFDQLKVTPGTIILTGQDSGQFADLRQQFVSSITLPGGAKPPPTIIHSSLARFVPPVIPLAAAEAYAAEHPLVFTQSITEFRLVETRREPMQDFTVLRVFPLDA